MPARNIIREYVPESYFHVYNRGVEKRIVFIDSQDYAVFLSYLRRHLSPATVADSQRRPYKYYGSVELIAYCLMPTHFHFLLFARDDPSQVAKLMQSICVAYSMYFNRRYKRVGGLFQGRFKAVRVLDDSYLQHITRYIHLNPADYKNWEWSSLHYFLDKEKTNWIHPERIIEIFNGDYREFVDDYQGQKLILESIKHELGE